MDDETNPSPEHDPHVLMAGDAGDLAEIRSILSLLPETAYGQVFIEATVPIQVVNLRAPRRVAITWLLRGATSSRDVVPRGELVRRAVAAWVQEWIPEQGHEHHGQHEHTHYYVWIGCVGSPRVRELYHSLQSLFGLSRSTDGHGH